MSAAMPMQNGMMGMMPMNMMGNMMPMNGMSMMPMGGNQMMNQMPMPMPMPMPMMCRMTCEMTKDGMVCKMMPMDASQIDMMRERCNAMSAMLTRGMPVMMMCGGMPIMMCMTGAGSH